jgi:predicted secreted protein
LPRVLSDRAHSSVRWLLFLILLAVPAATLVLAQPAVAQLSDDTPPDEAELRRRANALENQRQALLRESRDLAAERN